MAKKEITLRTGDSLHTGLTGSALLLGNFSYTQRLTWCEEMGLIITAVH